MDILDCGISGKADRLTTVSTPIPSNVIWIGLALGAVLGIGGAASVLLIGFGTILFTRTTSKHFFMAIALLSAIVIIL